MTLGAATATAVCKRLRERGMLMWFLRRGFWNLIAWGKFTVNKPLDIPLPPTERHVIEPKPMIEAIPEVPLRNVMVCPRADIPHDERVPTEYHVLSTAGLALHRVLTDAAGPATHRRRPAGGVETSFHPAASHPLPGARTAGRVSGQSRPRLAGSARSLRLLHHARR